ncbi:expressed unknown protein [Seminavis robusta]|uniref:Uncharacterized protein n=1 Tax=Seminavis robusta TaxID=568900 RepID=A0A9N8F175_9STRA|nr:expressed unknown protein [Seminavis robusta]|eukprot:Sro2242_g320420.1 n/a (400) ;mRNA; f:11067-12365
MTNLTLRNVRSRKSFRAKSSTLVINPPRKSQECLDALGRVAGMVKANLPAEDIVHTIRFYQNDSELGFPSMTRLFQASTPSIDFNTFKYQAEDDPDRLGGFIVKYSHDAQPPFLQSLPQGSATIIIETIHRGVLDGSLPKLFKKKQLENYLKARLHFDISKELPLALLARKNPDDDVFVTMDDIVDSGRYLAALDYLEKTVGYRYGLSVECIKAMTQLELLSALTAHVQSNKGKLSEGAALEFLAKKFHFDNVQTFYICFEDHPVYKAISCPSGPLPSVSSSTPPMAEILNDNDNDNALDSSRSTVESADYQHNGGELRFVNGVVAYEHQLRDVVKGKLVPLTSCDSCSESLEKSDTFCAQHQKSGAKENKVFLGWLDEQVKKAQQDANRPQEVTSDGK